MPLFPSSCSQISSLSSPFPAWKRKRRKQPSSKAQDEAELPTTTAGVRASQLADKELLQLTSLASSVNSVGSLTHSRPVDRCSSWARCTFPEDGTSHKGHPCLSLFSHRAGVGEKT